MPASEPAAPLLSPALMATLERLELVSRKIFRGRMKGERRSLRKGQSVEFADFRNYVPGDDLRFIDWNLFARLDRLFLKLFLEEEDLHFYALIDASGSMNFGEPSKLQFAKQLAAALGFIGLCRADRVKVEVLGSSRQKPAPVLRGRSSMYRLLDQLGTVREEKNVTLTQGVKDFVIGNSGKGIVVLITDLLDKSGYEAALSYLLTRQMDIYVVHVLAPEELAPEITGDLKLVDCEDGDIAEITVSRPLLNRYQQTLAAFIEGARTYCSQRGIAYLTCSSAVPVEQIVTSFLRRKGLVR
jgi:uncharacterized protein (DUF58 family)